MKFAIVRINPITGQILFRSLHSRWCKYLTSALLFEDSFAAVDWLNSYVHRSYAYRYEVREVVSADEAEKWGVEYV